MNIKKLLPEWDNLKKIGSKKEMINFLKEREKKDGWDFDDTEVQDDMYKSIFKINRTYYFTLE